MLGSATDRRHPQFPRQRRWVSMRSAVRRCASAVCQSELAPWSRSVGGHVGLPMGSPWLLAVGPMATLLSTYSWLRVGDVRNSVLD